jgi:catechol 2,3-dioxygenase-like lactoylglutathione lyase family enzyme
MAPSAISGINHVAVVTADLDRLAAFYGELFDASLVARFDDEQGRHGLFNLGAGSFLHAFEQRHNAHAAGNHDMFDRGHIDHFAVAARDEVSFEALRAELMRRGCSDGAVTDFGWSQRLLRRPRRHGLRGDAPDRRPADRRGPPRHGPDTAHHRIGLIPGTAARRHAVRQSGVL